MRKKKPETLNKWPMKEWPMLFLTWNTFKGRAEISTDGKTFTELGKIMIEKIFPGHAKTWKGTSCYIWPYHSMEYIHGKAKEMTRPPKGQEKI